MFLFLLLCPVFTKALYFPVAWPLPGLEFTKASFMSVAWPFLRLEFTGASDFPAAWPPFADGLTPGLGSVGNLSRCSPAHRHLSWHAANFTLVAFIHFLTRRRDLFDVTSMKSAMGTSLHQSFSAEDASSANAQTMVRLSDCLTPDGPQNTHFQREAS